MEPKRPEPAHLRPGSTVEVAPQDDGFKGSWYECKVLEKKTASKYLVEYTTMFVDETGTKPLRETIHAEQIRPVQPWDWKRARSNIGFEVGAEVDAYYSDGWWEGKVGGVVLGDGEEGVEKVEVLFDESGEKIVFGVENVRVHRVWDNGVWIPPIEDEDEDEDGNGIGDGVVKDKVNSSEENGSTAEEQEKVNMGEENDRKAEEQEELVVPRTRKRAADSPKQPDTSHLKPGSEVEISSDDAGFRGSWFIGTIIRCVCKKKPAKFLVEYKTLFEDEEGKKPLRETLHQYQLRPVQPTEKRPRKFKFADEVDAYFNDGWWEGDITGELGGERFNVYFRPAKEQLEFGEESLRIHREWINGAWDPPIEDEGTEGKEEYKKVD